MVMEVMNIILMRSDPENKSLDAHRNFDYLKAETQYSGDIFP